MRAPPPATTVIARRGTRTVASSTSSADYLSSVAPPTTSNAATLNAAIVSIQRRPGPLPLHRSSHRQNGRREFHSYEAGHGLRPPKPANEGGNKGGGGGGKAEGYLGGKNYEALHARRAPKLEMERMAKAASRLFAPSDTGDVDEVVYREARLVLQYFTMRYSVHRHHHGLQLEDGRDGSDLAEDVVRWVLLRGGGSGGGKNESSARREEAIKRVLGLDGNAALANLVEVRLIPCGTHALVVSSSSSSSAKATAAIDPSSSATSSLDAAATTADAVGEEAPATTPTPAGMSMSSSVGRLTIHPPSWADAIAGASRAVRTLHFIHSVHPDAGLKPDVMSLNAELHVLSKRAALLGVEGGREALRAADGRDRERAAAAAAAGDEEDKFYWREVVSDDDAPDTVEGCVEQMERLLADAVDNAGSSSAKSGDKNKNGLDCPTDQTAAATSLVVPNTVSYNHILATLARLRLEDAAERAEAYLRSMEKLEDEDLGLSSLSGHDGYEEGRAGPDAEERPIVVTAHPDQATYNAVLHAFASLDDRDAYGAVSSSGSYAAHHSPPPRVPRGSSGRSDYEGGGGGQGGGGGALLSKGYATRRAAVHAQRAATIFDRMKQRFRRGSGARPDAISFASVLHGYANAGMAREAEGVLTDMENSAGSDDRGGGGGVRPNHICYNTVLDAYAKCADRLPDAARRAESILRRMERLRASGINSDVRVDTVSYGSVITAWSRSCHRGGDDNDSDNSGAENAERLLHQSIELYQKGNDDVKPDGICFNAVLDAWAKRAGMDRVAGLDGTAAAKRAESLLGLMKSIGDGNKDDGGRYVGGAGRSASSNDRLSLAAGLRGIKPGIIHYNTLLNAWAKSGGGADAARRAESILDEMIRLSKEDPSLSPDGITYNIVMDAWAKSGLGRGGPSSRGIGSRDGAKAVRNAERIFQRMKAEGGGGGETSRVRHDTVSYNILMQAHGRSREKGSAERAEALLNEMLELSTKGDWRVRPNRVSFNIAIDGWARAGGEFGAQRAEAILRRMQTLSELEGNDDLRPGTIGYSSVLNALSRSGHPDAADRAEAILAEMEASRHARPNTICYNTVLNTLCKGGQIHRAESILSRMQEIQQSSGQGDAQPDHVTFSTLINGWARSGESGAAERAEAILRRMEDLGDSGNAGLRPNVISYGACLNAWARSKEEGAVGRALALLERMEERYRIGHSNARPNSICYNAVITTIAKSNHPQKALQGRDILERMKEAYQQGNRDAKPNVMTYSNILNACAHTSGSPTDRAETFSLARSCFLELLDSDTEAPNNLTYSAFLLCCGRLLPNGPDRDKLAESLFRECCEAGQVDDYVLRNFRNAASRAVYLGMIKESQIPQHRDVRLSVEYVPEEWSCNVRRRNQRKRQMR